MIRPCGFCGVLYNSEIYHNLHYCDNGCEYWSLLNKEYIMQEVLSVNESIRLNELKNERLKELEMFPLQ